MIGSAFIRTSPARPAGWHDDPRNPTLQRWSDGAGWTDLTRLPPDAGDAACQCC